MMKEGNSILFLERRDIIELIYMIKGANIIKGQNSSLIFVVTRETNTLKVGKI